MRQHRDPLFAEGIGATPAIAAMPPPDRAPGFIVTGPVWLAEKRKARKNEKPAGWRAFVELPIFRKSWSGRRDSNPRPRPWQGRALPLSYTRIPEIVALTGDRQTYAKCGLRMQQSARGYRNNRKARYFFIRGRNQSNRG
jgi:hypothetical protein